jgi:hypothetical protein
MPSLSVKETGLGRAVGTISIVAAQYLLWRSPPERLWPRASSHGRSVFLLCRR